MFFNPQGEQMEFFLRKRGGHPVSLSHLRELKMRDEKTVIHGRAVWVPRPEGRGRVLHRIDDLSGEIVSESEFILRQDKRGKRRFPHLRCQMPYFCH